MAFEAQTLVGPSIKTFHHPGAQGRRTKALENYHYDIGQSRSFDACCRIHRSRICTGSHYFLGCQFNFSRYNCVLVFKAIQHGFTQERVSLILEINSQRGLEMSEIKINWKVPV